MKFFLKNKTNRFFPSLLLVIAIFSHWIWFNFSTVLTYGDWYYWPLEALKQLYYSWGTWINYVGFGNNNIQISFNFFMFIWSFMANLGFGYDIVTKLTFFIPIAILGFISPYILAKKITNDNIIAFISAIFYGTTTVTLINQLPIQFVYVLTPLIIYFFIMATETNNFYQWIFFILSYWIGVCYEVRIMYIVTFILAFHFLFLYGISLKRYILNLIICAILLLGLNSFWILPTLLGGIAKTIETIISRGLFGAQLFDMPHALTIFNWLWTGSKPNNSFIVQPVIWYFWLFPILAFSTFLFFKKFNNMEKRYIVFFGFISLLGILLTKQSATPFSSFYEFLYYHFPGFSLFRESSKLFLLTTVGYFGLLSYLLLFIKKSDYKYKTFIFGLLSICIFITALWNIRPLITGEIGGVFVPRHISNDYVKVEKLIFKQNYYFRTLWIPVYSRWSFFDNNHPVVSNVGELDTNWRKFILNEKNTNKYPYGKLMFILLNKPFASNLLNISSIKYVFVPLEDKANDDNFFINYDMPRQYYINELNKINWLRRINIGTKQIVVYENENYRPHIYATAEKETIYNDLRPMIYDLRYKFVNPTEYTFSIKNVSSPFYLNFSEAFNMGWNVRVGGFNWFDVLKNSNYFVDSKNHVENDAGLNSFHLNPEIVCKQYSCIKNKDGSYDISGTLYFTPQSYMYLGLIISGSTLIIIFGYLGFIGFNSLKRKYERKNK